MITIAWLLDRPTSPAFYRQRSSINHPYHSKDTQSNIREPLPPRLCNRFQVKKGLHQALATSEEYRTQVKLTGYT